MRFNLVKKIILTIEVVVVLVAVIGGGSFFFILQDLVESNIKAQLESVVALKEFNLKRYYNEKIIEIGFAAQSESTQKLIVQFLLNKDDETRKKAFGTVVENIHHKLPGIFIIDKTGEIIASTNEVDEGKIKSTESYFLNAQKDLIVPEFYYDVATEQPTVLIATPIKDKNSMFLGVLVGKLDMQEISNLMAERSGLGKSGESFLVNSSNLVITDFLKEPGAALKRIFFSPQIKSCLEGNSKFTTRIDYHGDEVYGYWHWLPDTKLCMVTKIDRAEVLAPIQKTFIILFIITILVGCVVGLFGYFVGRTITAPIRQLREQISKIKTGNFDSKASVKTNDEFGEMANSFSDMALKLKEIYENLEEKVNQKTNELSTKVGELVKKQADLERINKMMVDRELKMIELKKEIAKLKTRL